MRYANNLWSSQGGEDSCCNILGCYTV